MQALKKGLTELYSYSTVDVMKTLHRKRPHSYSVYNLPKPLRASLKRRASKRGLSISAFIRQHLIREFGDDGR